MTLPPPPGAPFPDLEGRTMDPSADRTDPWAASIRERLLDERVVFVTEFLDDDTANRTAMELMTLDASGDEPVRLQVDCNGATLEASFALIDVIDTMGVEVHVLCAGQVVGCAVGVVAVAHRRLALAHTRFKLCGPKMEFAGRPRDIEAATRHQAEQMRRFHERLAQATGRDIDQIANDMRRGIFMGSEEAVSYGIVDEIVRQPAKVIDFPRRFGFRRI